MKRLKMMLMAMIAVLAIGAAGASAANAYNGEASMHLSTWIMDVDCDVEFEHDAWQPTSAGDPNHPGWKTAIYNFAPTDCDANIDEGSGWVYKNAAGQMTIQIGLKIDVDVPPFGTISCNYTGSGTGTYTQDATNKYFTGSGSATAGFPCPAATINPMTATMEQTP